MDTSKVAVVIIHRGGDDNKRVVRGDEIQRIARDRIVLKNGTELPFHRVIEVRYGDEVIFSRLRRTRSV